MVGVGCREKMDCERRHRCETGEPHVLVDCGLHEPRLLGAYLRHRLAGDRHDPSRQGDDLLHAERCIHHIHRVLGLRLAMELPLLQRHDVLPQGHTLYADVPRRVHVLRVLLRDAARRLEVPVQFLPCGRGALARRRGDGVLRHPHGNDAAAGGAEELPDRDEGLRLLRGVRRAGGRRHRPRLHLGDIDRVPGGLQGLAQRPL
mmetsp:Transcript_80510/g.260790  ORF Transcript_80510/g.260790 Transcript_80510/m.260790 type:complete len:203 (+) Transcript_80510:406-1014(+)